ncbi:MAG: DNA polymerase III subunit delta' [Thermodesulfobacteriota bacterium]
MFNNKIIGHDFQKNILLRAARDNMVSHSYIFSGQDGIGKKLIALEFAKLINCTSDNEIQADAPRTNLCECGPCSKVEKGIHPDVIYVEYEGVKSIKVEQIREGVEEKLYLKSFEGKYKVVIVDEAHRMSSGAQNAFLKTLEEPPPNSVIILITSSPDKLLPTIRSRCQLVRFNSLPQERIFQILEERSDLATEQALISSKLSKGSLGKALNMDSDLLEWRKELVQFLINLKPNSAMRIIGLAEYMPLGSSAEDMEKLEQTFEFISLWLRDLMLIKTGSEESLITNIDLIQESAEIAQSLELRIISERMSAVERTWNDIYNLNANKQLSFENLFIKLAS